MASLTESTRVAVEAAMQEYDTLGREAFLSTYGNGVALRHVIAHDALLDVKQHKTEGKYKVRQTAEEREAERIEQPLVLRYETHLNGQGLDCKRWGYKFDGVTYYTDLVIPEENTLIEAKPQVDRTTIRTGVGQLRDYDFMQEEANGKGFGKPVLLLRGRPSDSVLRMLKREKISTVWPVEDDWGVNDDA